MKWRSKFRLSSVLIESDGLKEPITGDYDRARTLVFAVVPIDRQGNFDGAGWLKRSDMNPRLSAHGGHRAAGVRRHVKRGSLP